MENFQLYETILRRLTSKPIRTVHFHPKSVHVVFEDGQECIRKYDLALRLFFISLQQVQCRRHEPTPESIPTPLGFFQLLGWAKGDIVEIELPALKFVIEFS